jgi:hypothetical protein
MATLTYSHSKVYILISQPKAKEINQGTNEFGWEGVRGAEHELEAVLSF